MLKDSNQFVVPLLVQLMVALVLISGCKDNQISEERIMKAPIAIKKEHKTKIHNIELIDNYNWLRDPQWPKVTDPQILDYLNAENKFTENYFSKLENKKTKLFEELKGRIKLTDQSVPVKKDEYFYYTRTLEDKDYPIYCRKKGSMQAHEEVLLDQNELAKGKKFSKIGAFAISPDHSLIAYSIDESGGERFTIKILDLSTKTLRSDSIPDTIGAIVWHEKLPGLFYTPCDENWRHDKVFFHQLGLEQKDDKLIYHEKDPVYSVNVRASSSKEYILLNVSGHDASEYYLFSMHDESMTPKIVCARKENHFYDIDHNNNYFYIHTNDTGKNFRIARAEVNSFSQDKWQDFIPHDASKYLKSFDLTSKYLILNYKMNSLPHIEVSRLSDKSNQEVKFPDSVYTAGAYSTNFVEDDIRIDYASLKRPDSVFNYDYNTNKLEVLKVKEIPSGFNSDEYEVERVWANSEEVKVPVSVFYKKSLFKKDGSNPLYLYGYGSYGYSIPPGFRASILSLVDRGFVFAIAHIRGGDDMGFDWYESAKFLNKKRTFNDFIASTEKLIEDKYTSKGNVLIVGGSAGGLLIGAVLNERPELYKAAIAHVPFVDVMYTMLDESLPLTPGEFKEWGNPKEKLYFDYMLSYSPYNNVKKQHYPDLFITAGLTDPRVGYWEAAKWAALLRELKVDNNLLLLKINMDAGHGGASGRFDYLKEIAEEMAFILDRFKVE